MGRLTKSTHFLVVQMTFTLEEFYKLYIREIVRLHGVPVSISIGLGSQVYSSVLEEFPEIHGDIIDDEHCVSSADRWSVGEGHTLILCWHLEIPERRKEVHFFSLYISLSSSSLSLLNIQEENIFILNLHFIIFSQHVISTNLL